MLKGKDLNSELKIIDNAIKEGKSDEKTLLTHILKALCLLNKLVRDVKTNQVTSMEAQGIKLLEPEVPEVRTSNEKK